MRKPRIPEKPGPRDCGSCRLCQDLDRELPQPPVKHGVVELQREPFRRLLGLGRIRKPEGNGCLWAQGIWGDRYSVRPDRTGVIPMPMRPPCRHGDIILIVDPAHPTAFRRNAVRRLIQVAQKQGRMVFLQTGPAHHYIEKAVA